MRVGRLEREDDQREFGVAGQGPKPQRKRDDVAGVEVVKNMHVGHLEREDETTTIVRTAAMCITDVGREPAEHAAE
jgi:hypothetical protein